MSSITQDVAFQTLDALEQRLQRVRFLLYGSASAAAADNDDQTPTDTTITQTQSIASRLQALQSSFNSVLSDSKSAQAIVALQSQHQHDGPDMTSDALAALVLSHAPSYQATAARLTSLQDTPVPNSSALAALVELHPRLERTINNYLSLNYDTKASHYWAGGIIKIYLIADEYQIISLSKRVTDIVWKRLDEKSVDDACVDLFEPISDHTMLSLGTIRVRILDGFLGCWRGDSEGIWGRRRHFNEVFGIARSVFRTDTATSASNAGRPASP
ncbi:hypothetical protein D6C83_04471 [Aureobasidium pullulans]|uniref:Uncharacterized protein n=1 Tax=Aureobasidium pullulans TaxID=5580 RepID=A0A4V4LIS4_AURPU|nr:hypothetical protein D6C83_04471 [Aureobasidium pullulans]